MKKRVWSFIILCWWARRQLSFFCFKMLMWNELYYSFLVQHIQWVSCSSVYVQVRTNYIKAGHSWHRWENGPTCLPNSVNIPGDLMVSNASFKRLLRVFLWRQKPVFQSWCCGADVSQNSCFHPSLLFTNANRFKKHKQKNKIDIRRQSIDSPDGIHHLFSTKAVYPEEIKACPNVFGQFNLG